MLRPTLRQFTYLIALDEEKSFSRAAESCHVTQSTLSAAIQELETIIGQKLVNRGTRGVGLTPFGMEILPLVRKIIGDTDSIIARGKKPQEPLTGVLRLGIIPTIAPYLLPAILPDLQKNYPKLDLQIQEDLSQNLIQKIEHDKLDGAIMAFPYKIPQNFTAKIILTEEFILAAPKSRKFPKHITTADLNPQELLLLEDGHCLRDQALSACDFNASRLRKSISATSLQTLLQMVEHGYGVTLLPRMAAGQIPHSIKTYPFAPPAPSRQIGLTWKNKSNKINDLDKIITEIKEIYSI